MSELLNSGCTGTLDPLYHLRKAVEEYYAKPIEERIEMYEKVIRENPDRLFACFRSLNTVIKLREEKIFRDHCE